MDYQSRLADIRNRIAQACARAGRQQEDVTIVAVTKYIGVEETEQLISAGQHDLGENRLQVALPKLEGLPDEMLAQTRWHYIGSLQTNKVKDVIGRFHMIHSLDRLALAEELNKRATQREMIVPCLVQVNVSGEASKGGFAPEEVPDFLRAAQHMPGIEIHGYMTMAPIAEDAEETRRVFRRMRELRDEWLQQGVAPQSAVHLSMGMSGDFEVAVEEGATFVRIGSILVK
ncbi:MAG: YggS family pyridoxal phosphate-dependent enzyme [Tumebacillaceae bacterium]